MVYLKNMIYWELGKPQIWEEMIKERTRLIKIRQGEEKAQEEAKQKHKEKMAEFSMLSLYFLGGAVILFALFMGGIGVYGSMEEKRIYEEKIAKAQRIRLQQHLARQAAEKAEGLKAVTGGG